MFLSSDFKARTPYQPGTPAASFAPSGSKAWSCMLCSRNCICSHTATSAGITTDGGWRRALRENSNAKSSWDLRIPQEKRIKEGYSYSKEILMQSMDREFSSSSFLWLCRETCRCSIAMSDTYFILKTRRKQISLWDACRFISNVLSDAPVILTVGFYREPTGPSDRWSPTCNNNKKT